jgi:hypothetical protein
LTDAGTAAGWCASQPRLDDADRRRHVMFVSIRERCARFMREEAPFSLRTGDEL